MRLNSLQVEMHHDGGRLLDPSSLQRNLKVQLTAQNAELSAMTSAGAMATDDELLSPRASA